MIFRATIKLLKSSVIKPVKCEKTTDEVFPGEWYGNILKTGHVGKTYVLLFHNTTKIAIICPTKSLNVAIKMLPERLERFLVRHKFESIIDEFELKSENKIFTTNDRRTLAFINEIGYNAEWHLSLSESLESCDLEYIEDIHTKYLFPIKGKTHKYETTFDILKRII
ncbi:MAG: hypothetical protein R6U65_05195 [Perlabentimonas sp.]